MPPASSSQAGRRRRLVRAPGPVGPSKTNKPQSSLSSPGSVVFLTQSPDTDGPTDQTPVPAFVLKPMAGPIIDTKVTPS